MQKLNILITCIGGVFALDTIEALRSDADLKIRVIGVDASPETINRFFVDAFYPVPLASERPEDFVSALRDICLKESVPIVIPGADEEVLVLSHAKKIFSDAGITCSVEDHAKVELMRDKASLFLHLSKMGIAMPKFFIISKAEDILSAANKLGYPNERFILKPRTGRGARGLIIVDSGVSEFKIVPSSRNYGIANLESVIERLQKEEKSLNLMAMEYLPGPAYDVDCLANKGIPLQLVVRRRLWKDPFSPMSQGCRIERNPDMESIVRQIVNGMKLTYLFDFDFGTTAQGKPGLLELNPRWSGAVAAALSGGINIPSCLVRTMIGLPVPIVDLEVGACMFPVTRMAFMRADSSRPSDFLTGEDHDHSNL